MATRNFWLRNADRYFVAVEPEGEDYDHFWFTYLTDNLEEIATNECGFSGMYGNVYDDWLHTIGSRCDATAIRCSISREYNDIIRGNWFVELTPVIRSGYYSGAVLDYDIRFVDPFGNELSNKYLTSNNVCGLIDDYIETLDEDEQSKLFGSRIVELKDKVQNIIQDVIRKFYEFAEQSGLDEYALKGVFSNGEDVYVNLSEIKRKAGKE